MEPILEHLKEFVEVHKDRRGGIPCLKETRIPFAQIIQDVSCGHTLNEIADEMDLNQCALEALFEHLATYFNKSFSI